MRRAGCARRHGLANVTQILSPGKHTSIIKLNGKSWNKSLGGSGLLFISRMWLEMGMGGAEGPRQGSAHFTLWLHVLWSILNFHTLHFLPEERSVPPRERPAQQVCTSPGGCCWHLPPCQPQRAPRAGQRGRGQLPTPWYSTRALDGLGFAVLDGNLLKSL